MPEEIKPKSNLPIVAATAVLTGALAGGAFFLGKFTKTETQAEPQATITPLVNQTEPEIVDLKIKGNKNSRIYHLPGCPNYNDISERNIRWFKTHEEAKAAGYRMARNC